MDNTAALADVIKVLIDDAEMTPHGLAVEAGIPWVTFRRRVMQPSDPGMRVGELERVAQALGKKPSELLAAAEERQALNA